MSDGGDRGNEQDGPDGDPQDGRERRDGRDGQDGDERESGQGREQVETIEWVVTAVSVGFTIALLGVVVWQSMTVPADVQPRVSIAGVETGSDGRVEVTVEFVNEGRIGLASATVELACTDPPTELVFEHVPASGRRQGTVVCPPGTTDPNATIAGWQEA